MRTKNKANMRYFYEYMFFHAVEAARDSAEAAQDGPLMVSQVRAQRARLDDYLAQQGTSMGADGLSIAQISDAIDSTLGDPENGIPGYTAQYPGQSSADLGYQKVFKEYCDMIGAAAKEPGAAPDAAPTMAKPGIDGPRLPISPYDPRFAGRATVKQTGSALLFVPADVIDQHLDGDMSRVATTLSSDVNLFSQDYTGDQAGVERGPIRSLDDAAGLSQLMGYMSQDEYRKVRPWVLQGARHGSAGGVRGYDVDKFMSAEGLQRSIAVLEELNAQGVGYKIVQDRYPGQIAAKINGTKISVNLTKLRDDEAYVGSVYDDGVKIHFTTDAKASDGKKNATYLPSPSETVMLLRVAQGKPVERTDGKGLVGVSRVSPNLQRNSGSNDVYLSGSAQMMCVGDYVDPSTGKPVRGAQVFVRRDASSRTAAARYFVDDAAGEEYLRDAVTTARQNFATALDTERLIIEAGLNLDEIEAGTYVPEFSGDATIASIQRSYWDVLSGNQSTLLRPGTKAEQVEEFLGAAGEDFTDEIRNLAYDGSPEDKVRAHAEEIIDVMVGTYDAQQHGADDEPKRFNPATVSNYMESGFGSWRNNDDIIAAIKAAKINPEELAGDSFFNKTIQDRLIEFDSESSVNIAEHDSEFVRKMGTVITDSLNHNGVTVTSVDIDENGLVQWSGVRAQSKKSGPDPKPVTGQIGQIFVPGEYGEITTRFNGGDNYMFVPGYEAEILPQKLGENKNFVERTRLRGYEQLLTEQIQYQIANDALSGRTEVGSSTGLNNVYRRLYDVRHEPDFIERSLEEGMTQEWIGTLLETEGSRVRYSNEMRDGSTLRAEYVAEHDESRDPRNDNFRDPWVLSGQKNLSILGRESDGFFDPIVTAGSTNQGITRYLVQSAQVNPDGSISQGDVNDRVALMKHPDTAEMAFDTFDRQQMTASNLMQAAAVTEPVKTAMMTFGGWTADDPLVISEKFAQKHHIRGVDGKMRPLVVGDKLSDLHGNKGVVSLVVDPEKIDQPEIQSDMNLRNAYEVFAKNPELEVVMSPFSAVSRFNGGSARELMKNSSDLELPEIGTKEAAMGEMRFIVTHMAVDAKTRVYDDNDVAVGKGRKFSSQLAWAMGSKKAENIMKEIYGNNNSASANLREQLITMGLDMGPDGTLVPGNKKDGVVGLDNEQRRFFAQPELELNKSGGLNVGAMKRQFGQLIGDKGGDLEIPFPLRFPTEYLTEAASENTYKLPVMSSHLRSGQELRDGSSTVHDYTNQYMRIFEQACQYRHAQNKIAEGNGDISKYESILARAPEQAQMAFNSITDDLKERRFSGKHNVFKEQVMSNRATHSATAVWSSDPRLELEQVSMGSSMMESLDLKEGDSVLIWRDPILRDSGVRYMEVKRDDRLTGIAINPVMDKCFDGDFDGDSVAVVKLNTEAAKREAYEKFSVPANLLDFGEKLEDGTYPLAIQNSLDVKVSQFVDPSLQERLENLRLRANDIHFDESNGEITAAEALALNEDLTHELSDCYHEALDGQYGDATLSFKDMDTHLNSVLEACVDTGAKGSEGKVQAYCRYIGAEWNGDFEDRKFIDLGKSQATRDDHMGVQKATAVKSFGTGVAGAASQRGVKGLRNECLKEVLELTYPVTQSVLQIKHSPEEADAKYETLMGPARSLWQGKKLEPALDLKGRQSWTEVRVDGDSVQCTPEEFKAQFIEIYSSEHGLNVKPNEDFVNAVTKAMTNEDGKIVSIEDADNSKSSPMDQLAYGGSFDTLVELAQENANLFSGKENGHFAPYAVQQNQKELTRFDKELEMAGDEVGIAREPELKSLTPADVQVDGKARGSSRRHEQARGVGGRVERSEVDKAAQKADAQSLQVVAQQKAVADADLRRGFMYTDKSDPDLYSHDGEFIATRDYMMAKTGRTEVEDEAILFRHNELTRFDRAKEDWFTNKAIQPQRPDKQHVYYKHEDKGLYDQRGKHLKTVDEINAIALESPEIQEAHQRRENALSSLDRRKDEGFKRYLDREEIPYREPGTMPGAEFGVEPDVHEQMKRVSQQEFISKANAQKSIGYDLSDVEPEETPIFTDESLDEYADAHEASQQSVKWSEGNSRENYLSPQDFLRKYGLENEPNAQNAVKYNDGYGL